MSAREVEHAVTKAVAVVVRGEEARVASGSTPMSMASVAASDSSSSASERMMCGGGAGGRRAM